MSEPSINTESATRLDIRAEAISNDLFRRVIRTGHHEQVVVTAITPAGETGEKVHLHQDQLFVVVDGTGEARVGDLVLGVWPGDLVFVPAGTRHNIVNRTAAALRLVTVYAPPAFAAGTVHRTKADADAVERSAEGGAGRGSIEAIAVA